MATRFYLPSSGTPPLASLGLDASWTRSNDLVRLPCDVIKSNTSLTQKSATWGGTTSVGWVWAQFQSKCLAAGYSWTTADTVSMVIKVAEAAAQVDSHLAYSIKVVSKDGSAVRGTIGEYLTTSSEYPTNLASIATRIHSARTNGASNFSSQVGDRIIIEIGHWGVTPTANVVYHNYGDPTATEDYALTADLTTDLCPWVELSRTVDFDNRSSKHANLTGTGADKDNQAAYLQGSSAHVDIYTNTGRLKVSALANAAARVISKLPIAISQGVKFKFRWSNNTNSANFRITIRSSKDWNTWDTPTSGYEIRLQPDSQTIDFYSTTAGTRSGIDSWTGPELSTNWRWISYQIIGSAIRFKIWDDGGAEPDWQKEWVNTTVSGLGGLQLGLFGTSNAHVLFLDDFTHYKIVPGQLHAFLQGATSSFNADSSKSAYLTGPIPVASSKHAYLLGSLVSSGTVTLQPGPTDGIDAYIDSYVNAQEGGDGPNAAIQSGRYTDYSSDQEVMRGLLKFTLTNVPSNVTITSAKLQLYYFIGATSDYYNVMIHRSLVEWYESIHNVIEPGEDASCWAYRNYNGSELWDGGEGGAAGTEWVATPTATTSVGGGGFEWFEWDVTSDVQLWVDGTLNHGWWILGTEVIGRDEYRQFRSSDYGVESQRPKLIITWAIPGSTKHAFLQGTTGAEDSKHGYLEGQAIPGSSSQAAFLEPAVLLQPSGDTAVNGWTNQLSESVLYTAIDEIDPDDADYAHKADAQVNDYFEIELGDVGETWPEGDHVLTWRAYYSGQQTRVKCELRQGTNIICSDEHLLGSSATTYEYTLTPQEVDLISNYNDLRLRFIVTEVI